MLSAIYALVLHCKPKDQPEPPRSRASDRLPLTRSVLDHEKRVIQNIPLRAPPGHVESIRRPFKLEDKSLDRNLHPHLLPFRTAYPTFFFQSLRRFSSRPMTRPRRCRRRPGAKKAGPASAAPVRAVGHSIPLGRLGDGQPNTLRPTQRKRKVDQLTTDNPDSVRPGEHHGQPPLPTPAAQEASCQTHDPPHHSCSLLFWAHQLTFISSSSTSSLSLSHTHNQQSCPRLSGRPPFGISQTRRPKTAAHATPRGQSCRATSRRK
jgi:hypothetical protein